MEILFQKVLIESKISSKNEKCFLESQPDLSPTKSDGLEHQNLDLGRYKTNLEEDTEKFSNKVWCGSGPACNDHVWDME